ncbi:hypothetical protein HA402_015189 [Bradysia odoriphaga]|nr:hypothetical protein HA402_015189 [Bradysia odoriphaga]
MNSRIYFTLIGVGVGGVGGNASLTATATESIQFDGRALSLGSGTLPAPPNQTVPSDAAATHRSSPTFTSSQSKLATSLTIASPDPIQSGVLNTTPTSTTNPTSSSASSPLQNHQQRQSVSPSPVTSSNQLDSDAVTTTVLNILNNNSLIAQSQNSPFQFGSGTGGVSAASGISKTGNSRFEPVVNMPPPDSPHAEPAPRKRRRKREDPQSCFTNSEEYDSDDASPVSCSDVESFQGKIVYNPDGSAYIIDSENDSLSNISENGLGAVNDYFGLGVPATNNPKIHSFRVVTARDATVNISEPNSKISKPILMCFICKLSFGNTKSFSLHAANEHALNLQECEKMLLNREYSSAIIQRNGDEKPQISFLEPLDVQKQMQHTIDQQSLSKSNDLAVKTLSDYHQSLITAASTASTTQSTNVSTSATTVATSNQISTENTNSSTGNTASNSKFLSELFLQQQQLQQQRESTPLQCPDHQGMKGIDCKTCEMMNVSIKSPMTPIKSPNNLNMTPPGSSSVNMSPTTPAPSFTIGACPEHINGRPIGVECPRCELILNSARLNSGVQISTRNSCKTLKCPQCNWHYKYQETLEIHMREKHPDGESACGYCLAGQQHPRLARGESYTCGYKPYRCEICNYSTTTKGNLSIHMQSDKHLNNMQELNSTQSLSQTSEIRESPKIILPNMSQQSAKPKPSFRCDVCSYETSVARNLRIHMTSEKHTHNMAVLQNNIKHLQALSFLQSQNIGQLPSLNNMPNLPNLNQSIPNLQQNVPNLAQNLPNFLPEAALADLAYNQALMIQLLHQNSAASASGGLGGNSSVPGATSSNLTGGVSPVSASRANSLVTPNSNSMVESDHGLNPDSFEPPIEPDVRPTNLFSCLVCACYNTNNIEELNNHLLIDRSRSNYNTDIMIISNSNYHCSLCKYNTNLKANFQLHSKTDKHIQKLNYINHIKEGGIKNEYKLKYNGNNSVQLKCNCCDYYTNSIQKLNLHTQNMRHENAKIIFNHLVYTIQECNKNSVGAAGTGNNVSSGSLSSSSDHSDTGAFDNGTGDAASDNNFNQKVLFCQLCNYKAPHILGMVQHVKSLRHVQIEQIICLQRRSENADSLELVDVFKVVDLYLETNEGSLMFSSSFSDDKNDKSSPQHSPVPKSLADQLSAVAAIQQHQQQLSAAAALGDQLGHSAAIFKCNHCNHFTETKTEIEQHLAIHHPNCGENDFFVIPTNTAQAAAAAAMAYQMAQSAANKPSPSIEDDIKSEKLDDDNGSDCGGDLADCEAIDTTDEMCGILCPLCQETFSDKKSLEKHVVTVHSVTSDGLARLLNLVDANQWMSSKKSPSIADCKSDGEIECTTCGTGFKAMMELFHHANDNQHYQMTSDNTYACVLRTCHANFPTISNMNAHFKDCHMNIVISERHVYKYRCKLCSLAFKTQDKLNNHSLYHTMRDATKCNVCNRNFRSTQSLQKHMDQAHNNSTSVSPTTSPGLDFLEKFAEKFKSYYLESAENENEILDFSSKKEIKEKGSDASKVLPTPQQQLLQQAQQQLPASLAAVPELAQKLNIDPTVLAQKMMEQNFANLPPNFANLPQNLQSLQSLQGLQNLQNLQNLPNMGNLPMNTLEMLNLMQFHHLMSLNFMNLAPPLIFGGTGASSSIPSTAGATGGTVTPNEISTNAPQQVQILQQQAAAAQAAAVQQVSLAAASNNQKRARTRITDEQLKILRAHFDINNSPSEESIKEMSFKANLPPKVVKHWFRNTLFKERQRNKDSPYNFNNPPSTTLNLEEYERTGQTKVTSLSNDSADLSTIAQQQQQQQQQSHQQDTAGTSTAFPQHSTTNPTTPSTSNERPSDIQVKSEPGDEIECGDSMKNEQMIDHDSSMHSHHTNMYYNNFETKSESGSSEILSRPPTPNSSYNNINEMINQQIESIPINNITNMGVGNIGNSMGPPKKFQMNMKLFDKSFESNSNSSNSSTSSGKRANRTRFTDYQIKVLQEFFENNSYPKDSDLEYLSKLLSLSPRVIVVWFQNARQKQRKIYENQPNNSYYESAEEKKPNINYTCKKCNLVFQRYYELIRHQKNHCFKEENNKKSAKAQIAAAQIAQSLSSEDSNSSIDINNASSLLSGNIAAGLQAQNLSLNSPNMLQSSHSAIPGLSTSPNLSMLSSQHSIFGKSGSAGHQSPQSTSSQQSPTQKYECDKCNLMFSRYELYKEHQLIHLMNPNLFLQQSLNQQYSENSPFGILQNLSSNAAAPASSSTSDTMDLSQKQKKRKFSETSQDNDHNDYDQLNKKLKNEQFEFLYNYFVQNEGADEIVKAKNIDFESLYTYYQTNELKKKGNFDFLYQYYVQNERPMDMSEKPSFEFLFQYYQINESKKFFQLEASPSKNDFLMMNLTSTPKNPTAPSTPTTALSKQQQTTANSSSGMLSETAVAATVGRQTPINQSMSTNQPSLTGSVGGGGLIIHNQNSNGSSTCGTVTNPADLLIQSMHQGEITSADKQNNKRLRTTILPEQLNFLYECYQNESNPSRKMLEEISKKVNLKKRVVQVWFQNARAKDKKSRNSRYTDEESVSGGMTANPSPDLQPIIDDCKICGVQKVNMQEHVFSSAHIAQVKASIEGADLSDHHDDGQNLTKPQQSPTPASSISSTSSIPSATNMMSQQSSTHDAMGLYNQFLLQNHMFGQLSGALSGNQSSDQHQELLALQHHLSQQQQAALNNSGSSTSTTNGSGSQQPTPQQLLMENNLLLQINADNQPTTNSEILQQLYSYSQMSGELIK